MLSNYFRSHYEPHVIPRENYEYSSDFADKPRLLSKIVDTALVPANSDMEDFRVEQVLANNLTKPIQTTSLTQSDALNDIDAIADNFEKAFDAEINSQTNEGQ